MYVEPQFLYCAHKQIHFTITDRLQIRNIKLKLKSKSQPDNNSESYVIDSDKSVNVLFDMKKIVKIFKNSWLEIDNFNKTNNM